MKVNKNAVIIGSVSFVFVILIGVIIWLGLSLKSEMDKNSGLQQAQSSNPSTNTNENTTSTPTPTNTNTALQGPPGPSGVPGKDGKDGVNGTNGQDGKNGVSGYEIKMSSWQDVAKTEFGTVPVYCPNGKKAVSVNCYQNSLTSPNVYLRGSWIYANQTGGNCTYYNGSAQTISIMAQVVCVQAN